MSERANPSPPPDSLDLDSLDIVELVMAIDAASGAKFQNLSPTERERLLLEIATRIKRGDLGDDGLDDDALAALVRKAGPRGPRGQAGAAARPEDS